MIIYLEQVLVPLHERKATKYQKYDWKKDGMGDPHEVASKRGMDRGKNIYKVDHDEKWEKIWIPGEKLKGVLIKESLQDTKVLDSLSVTNTKTVDIDNPAPDQPSIWNLVYFQVPEVEAGELAEKFSRSLKSGTWYIDFKSEQEIYVVFLGRVFHYRRGAMEKRKEAQAYGRSLGIPEKQLNWKE